ncbi:hypothetical protein LH935_15160 [Gordonia polyisoprenivorans]|uniref:hypothetical protein n=1 Tax=Gordonia polyisoprenivorans TaxID=84595 RepID=UPI0019DB85B4|nr:hypothetical protein [Gordonia polyisoprenivorans]UZF54101.1 hypothetical protein LH935_15160 [Gordonia polyisoprenivorans]
MYDDRRPSRPPWVIPVVVGCVVGLIAVAAVIVGLKLSGGQWNTGPSTAAGSTAPTVVVTQTTTESATPTETTPDDTTPEDTTPQGSEPSDAPTPSLPVPAVADTVWYAQFGAFGSYRRAEQARDNHYGSLILPGEMLGSGSRYVVARPAESRTDAEDVCAHFDSGSCVVKQRVE